MRDPEILCYPRFTRRTSIRLALVRYLMGEARDEVTDAARHLRHGEVAQFTMPLTGDSLYLRRTGCVLRCEVIPY